MIGKAGHKFLVFSAPLKIIDVRLHGIGIVGLGYAQIEHIGSAVLIKQLGMLYGDFMSLAPLNSQFADAREILAEIKDIIAAFPQPFN